MTDTQQLIEDLTRIKLELRGSRQYHDRVELAIDVITKLEHENKKLKKENEAYLMCIANNKL